MEVDVEVDADVDVTNVDVDMVHECHHQCLNYTNINGGMRMRLRLRLRMRALATCLNRAHAFKTSHICARDRSRCREQAGAYRMRSITALHL